MHPLFFVISFAADLVAWICFLISIFDAVVLGFAVGCA